MSNDELTYNWEFGDNTTGDGVTTTHNYQAPGSYLVNLMVSDGELDEGSTWEAVKFAGQKRLNNLMVILDYNKITACQRISLEPIEGKISNFGWLTKRIDGHSLWQVETALQQAEKPLMIVADKIKGKGVSYMEDSIEWHYRNLTQELLEQALRENG